MTEERAKTFRENIKYFLDVNFSNSSFGTISVNRYEIINAVNTKSKCKLLFFVFFQLWTNWR